MQITETDIEEAALTLWIFKKIEESGRTDYTNIDREIGFADNREGKALSKLWRGTRRHTFYDLDRYSKYFDTPKHIIIVEMERIARFFRSEVVEYIKTRKAIQPRHREIILKKIA